MEGHASASVCCHEKYAGHATASLLRGAQVPTRVHLSLFYIRGKRKVLFKPRKRTYVGLVGQVPFSPVE